MKKPGRGLEIIEVRERQSKLISRLCDFMRQLLPKYYNDLIEKEQINYITFFIHCKAIQNAIKENIFRYCYILKNNKDAGFIKYVIEKDHIYLSQIHIAKRYQKKGIGRFAIEHLKNIALKNGLKLIVSYILTYDTKTQEIFIKLGFKKGAMYTKYIGDKHLFWEDEFRLAISDDPKEANALNEMELDKFKTKPIHSRPYWANGKVITYDDEKF